ncbi:MAG: hypothetical protein Q9205_007228, partial [Flavoplaca limonia]
LFLSQNDEPQESLSRTQKAPKKSTLQKRKSNLTTPAVARALRTCGRLYPNEADALADETDEDPDLEKDEEEDDEKAIKSDAMVKTFRLNVLKVCNALSVAFGVMG